MAESETTQRCVRDDVNVCQLCGDLDNLSVCGGCRGAWYCSKSHQKLDWKKHKLICKRAENGVSVCDSVANAKTVTKAKAKKVGLETNTETETMTNNKVKGPIDDGGQIGSSVLLSSDVSSSSSSNVVTVPQCNLKGSKETPEIVFSRLSNKTNNNEEEVQAQDQQFDLLTKMNQPKTYKTKQKTRRPDASQNVQHQRYYLDQTTQVFHVPPSISALSKNGRSHSDSSKLDSIPPTPSLGSKDQYMLILQARFNEVSKYVVECLTKYGICVVDKFLGESTCQRIFDEAIELKSSGVMNQGQLVNGPSSASKNKHIRGDIITWLEGGETTCQNIHFLISCMDTVMLRVAKSLENCNINERTKGMVACYPGRGRGYIRHIDNPHGDGRCVTSLYYLNKDWDVKTDGGLLRIYPEGSDHVANIEPVADRLLFFWSDRRNPHEVEKALRERYAITVWYYDADERAKALKRLKDGASS